MLSLISVNAIPYIRAQVMRCKASERYPAEKSFMHVIK